MTVTGDANASRARWRVRIYAAVWIVGLVILIAGAFYYVDSKKTARADATVISETRYTHPTCARCFGTSVEWSTRFTWEVDGVSYTGNQQRSDQGDYATPPFVCYDPANPSAGRLGSKGETDCWRPWDTATTVANFTADGLVLVITLVALWKWWVWRGVKRRLAAYAG